MTKWRPFFAPEFPYFVTTTAVQRQHLFRQDVIKRIVVDTLDCMRLRGRFKLYAFVVMPNHVHLMMQCPEEHPLEACVRDFKKHVADRVIRFYRVVGNEAVLEFLSSAAGGSGKQRYKVWEEGYDAREVFSPEFLEQKLSYLHRNPCQAHWELASDPEEYVWSSARFYVMGEPTVIPVDHVNEYLA